MDEKFRKENWRAYIPEPVYKNKALSELYHRAWELAHDHVRSVDGMPQTPYMDEAFCETHIWIWDTCFMSLFCKFAREAFPGVESFQNFYHVLHDGGSLPKVIPSEKEPRWAYKTPGVPNEMYIHIADNPPLFAWGEYENALFSGDTAYLKGLLYEKQYLQKHYEWFESLSESVIPPGVFAPTYLVAERKGYRWEGGKSGMDNTPRGRLQVRDGKERPGNRDMLWIDAISEQALSAQMIAELFRILGDCEQAAVWDRKYEEKKKLVRENYWDPEDGFYYDIDIHTGAFYKVKTPASYWTLLSRIASPEEAHRMVEALRDPEILGGEVPLISLARNDGDYYPDGRYWRGGLWMPTAYMILKGLTLYGYHEDARLFAAKILRHMDRTYREYTPHTIWECYSPEKPVPALTADGKELVRRDFCGWSALGPIAMYIEFVLGFSRVDAFRREVEWHMPEHASGEIGIRNLRFGNVVTSITAKDGLCTVLSNEPYTLFLHEKPYSIGVGRTELPL